MNLTTVEHLHYNSINIIGEYVYFQTELVTEIIVFKF